MEYKDEDILRILTQKNPEDLTELKHNDFNHLRFKFNENNKTLHFNNFNLSTDNLYNNHFEKFYFQLITFRNCSFKGMNFSNMAFLGCGFIDCNFQDCSLDKVTFNRCTFNNLSNIDKNITSVLFNNCHLSSGDTYFDLQNIKFTFCGFKNCNLVNIDFTSSQFIESFLIGEDTINKIDNSIFKNCKFLISTIENLYFSNVLFDNARFRAAFHNIIFDYGNSFNDCQFYNIKNLIEPNEGITFKNVIFKNMGDMEHRNVQFKGGDKAEDNLILSNFKIIDTNFPNSYFYNVLFDNDELIYENTDCEIKGTISRDRKLNFQNSTFENVNMHLLSEFELINFTGTTFSNCDMPLTHSNLLYENCKFEDTNIENILNEENDNQITPYFALCSFRGADMTNMTFLNAEFEKVVFSNENTILENALFKECLFYTVVLSHLPSQRHPSSAQLKNVSFIDCEFINCIMQNEINNIDFSGSNLLKMEFNDNALFNQESYRENNRIIVNNNTILPQENFRYGFNYDDMDVDILRLQEQQLLTKIKEIIKDNYENEIDDFEGSIGNRVFPTEDGKSYSIFDIINGDIEITPSFFQDNPTYRLICRKQVNNLFPYIIDLEVLKKFNQEIQTELSSEYLGNIIFECDKLYSMEEVTDDDNILNTEPYVNMKVFGIQGIMMPLSDILAIPNNLNTNKKVYILDEEIENKTEYPILSLKYALLKEGSLNCTVNEPIVKATLKYINPNRYQGTPDIIRALTPVQNRSNSTTLPGENPPQTFIPIDSVANAYTADQEDNMSVEDSDASDEEDKTVSSGMTEIYNENDDMMLSGSKKKIKTKAKKKRNTRKTNKKSQK